MDEGARGAPHTIGYAGALHDPAAATLFCAPQSAKFTVITGKVIVRDSEWRMP